jgi:hypothetical protein
MRNILEWLLENQLGWLKVAFFSFFVAVNFVISILYFLALQFDH